jgi:putative chitinase
VRSGDTLSAIAARFHTTVGAIERLNGITDPTRLRIGQLLMIP